MLISRLLIAAAPMSRLTDACSKAISRSSRAATNITLAVQVGDTHGQFGPFSDPSSILRVEKEGGLFQQTREELLLSSTDFRKSST